MLEHDGGAVGCHNVRPSLLEVRHAAINVVKLQAKGLVARDKAPCGRSRCLRGRKFPASGQDNGAGEPTSAGAGAVVL